MLGETGKFYLLITSMLSIIGLLLRLTWQTSRFVEALRRHVKEADERFHNHDERITWLERRRR